MNRNEDTSVQGPTALTVHLVARGARQAADWYKNIWGAEERGSIPVPHGKFMQIELRVGGLTLMVADEFADMGVLGPVAIGGTAVVFHLVVPDARLQWDRAMGGGAEVVQPLQEQFWGELYGQIRDPFGHRWGIAQALRDVPRDEIAQTAWKLFGGE